MRDALTAVLCAAIAVGACTLLVPNEASAAGLIERAHSQRLAASDLELGGDLQGAPAGTKRYLSRADLLTLPQVSYTVSDDSNFTGPTEISGVLLEDLINALAASDSDLVIAVCDDDYRAHYPRSYLTAHHPVLVLKINGQDPEQWPKDAGEQGQAMGPYLISHRQFTPSFKILSHADQSQIPWGVVRLEFRNEKAVLEAIAPAKRYAADSSVQAGYRIAQQNCLRCHNAGQEGGLQAHHPWLVLSAWAAASPEHFAKYVRFPKAENPNAQMHPNPGYDDATLAALTAYFRTFTSPEKP